MTELDTFLNILFDENQRTCFTKSPKGTTVKPKAWSADLFFCINALHSTKDLNPTEEYHSQDKPRRADANVVCYRNFLIEIDDMPLKEQVSYVTSKIPVSTIVFSGSKSKHFIISLDTPLSTKEEYDNFSNRLRLMFPASDSSVKNCSRLSRLPCRMRPETKQYQNIEYLGKRISFALLDRILPKVEKKPKAFKINSDPALLPANLIYAIYHPNDIMRDVDLSGRNALFIWLGCRLGEQQMTLDKKIEYIEIAYNSLNNHQDFTMQEAKAAARI